MAAMMAARSATPPMATPAMPPLLRPLEPEDAAASLEDSDGDDSEPVIVVGLDAEPEDSEGEVEYEPSAVRLAYGSQSELGTASGHVGSWHSDRS